MKRLVIFLAFMVFANMSLATAGCRPGKVMTFDLTFDKASGVRSFSKQS